jgi:hypothetical protein
VLNLHVGRLTGTPHICRSVSHLPVITSFVIPPRTMHRIAPDAQSQTSRVSRLLHVLENSACQPTMTLANVIMGRQNVVVRVTLEMSIPRSGFPDSNSSLSRLLAPHVALLFETQLFKTERAAGVFAKEGSSFAVTANGSTRTER